MGGHQSPPVRGWGRLYSDTCKGGGEGYNYSDTWGKAIIPTPFVMIMDKSTTVTMQCKNL